MAIMIKPSHKWLLHKKLGVPAGKKIPAKDLKITSKTTPATKKQIIFAENAKKRKH